MSNRMNKRQNNRFLVAPSKITLEFKLSRIFQCLTQLSVLGFSEVQTKQAIKCRLTCRVIHIRCRVIHIRQADLQRPSLVKVDL